jgi:hypothetical protein
LPTIDDFAACLRVGRVLLVATCFDASDGVGEIAGGGGAVCSTWVGTSLVVSASLSRDPSSLKGNLSAFVRGVSSLLETEGVVSTAVSVVAGRTDGVPALIIVVRMKRAPTRGAHSRASHIILGIAAGLSAELIYYLRRRYQRSQPKDR